MQKRLMIFNVSLIIVVIISAYLATIVPLPIPGSGDLAVPYHDQGNEAWCAAASCLMLLDYWHVTPLPSLSYVADKVQRGTTMKETFESYGLHATYARMKDFAAGLEEIEKDIACGEPVIVDIWINTTDSPRKSWVKFSRENWAHSVVITGYNASGVFMTNPWAPSPAAREFYRTNGWIPPGQDNYLPKSLFQRLWSLYDDYMVGVWKDGYHQPFTPLRKNPLETPWFYVSVSAVFIIGIVNISLFTRRRVEPPSVQQLPRTYLCPVCGNSLTFIEQYQRWYCYRCQRYV